MSEFEEMPSKSILDCPEELLQQIFSYLDATTLYQLSMTCEYFKNTVEGRPCLWKCIDVREGHNSDAKTEFCINMINKSTSHICVRGNEECYGKIPSNFVSIINSLKNLKVIALENQKFDGTKVCLKDFPGCLEELSIKNSLVKRSKYFFKNSDLNMQKLRVLIVDGCRWMHSSYFVWITKYKNLEILSAANCMNSKFFSFMLWEHCRCKNLRIIDFRFSLTQYVDELDVRLKPLRIIYFQNVLSAESDYGVKIPYKLGRNFADIGTWSDFEYEISETFYKYSDYVFGENNVETLPVSYLYKDPYTDCKCNYKERQECSGSYSVAGTMETYSGNKFLAFHKEAMEVDWNDASTDHSDEAYGINMSDSDNSLDSDSLESHQDEAVRRLSFRGFEDVDDDILKTIRNYDLDLVDLTGTKVTKQGIEDFLIRIPNRRDAEFFLSM